MNITKLLLVFSLFFFLAISCNMGELIDNDADFSSTFIKLISYPEPTNQKYSQGMDILNGYVFQAYSDGTIDIININTMTLIQSIGPLLNENNKILHMNDLSFVKINNEQFLLIPGNSINELSHLYRVLSEDNLFSLEKYTTVTPPLINDTTYRSTTQYFSDNYLCIQVAYKRLENDGFGNSVLACYEYDHINDDIQYNKIWSVEHDKMWAMQGGVIVDNYCYMAVGVSSGDAIIYQINLDNGSISCYIDFRKSMDYLKGEEMQGISYYKGYFYFSTTYGLYKLL